MHDHNRSLAGQKSRKLHGYETQAGSPGSIYILTLLQRDTKMGNRRRIIDLAMPAGFNQCYFEEYFLKAFLVTNLVFTCSNNCVICWFIKYLRESIKISCPMTLSRHLTGLGISIIEKIRASLLTGERFLLVAIQEPGQTSFLF